MLVDTLFSAPVLGAGAACLLVVLLLVFIASRIKVADASEAYIIAGSQRDGRARVVMQGSRAVVWPIINSYRRVELRQIPIRIELSNGVDKNLVPIRVRATAVIKVNATPSGVLAAGERFFGYAHPLEVMSENISELLVGSLRAIVSNMTTADLIGQRDHLVQQVKNSAEPEMNAMGIMLETLNISDITDDNGYIESLGQKESSEAKAKARAARAESERQANEAEVSAELAIEKKRLEFTVKKAEMQAEQDRAMAVAESAGPLKKAERDREIADMEAQTAKARAALTEQELDISVKKPADAERYRRTQEAEAARIEKVALAQAEAEQVRANGQARAEATRMQGEAEAEAMAKKAEAMRRYGQAAKSQMVLEALPQLAKAVSDPIGNISDLRIISTEGANSLTKTVANNMGSIDQLLQQFTGTSLSDLMNSLVSSDDEEQTVADVAPAVVDVPDEDVVKPDEDE